MTLGVRCDDLTVNLRGDDILTLERVVGFCEYSIVNMIIDQLKHSDGREENKTLECLERVIGNKSRSVVFLCRQSD